MIGRGAFSAAVVAVLGMALPHAAQAGWTRVGTLPVPDGHDAVAAALAEDATGKLAIVETTGAGRATIRVGRLSGSGFTALAGDPLFDGAAPSAGADVAAGSVAGAPGAVALAWAEPLGGGREHLAVARVVNGAVQRLPSPAAGVDEYGVEPQGVAIGADGSLAVAYRAGLAPGGERHVRLAVLVGAGFELAHAGPWLTGDGGTPADEAAIALDAGGLVAVTASTSAPMAVLRRSGATGWVELGTVGPPAPWNLHAPRVVAQGGIVRAAGAGALGIGDWRGDLAGAAPAVQGAIPAGGSEPVLAGLDGVPDGACALTTAGGGLVTPVCRDGDGAWSVLGAPGLRGNGAQRPLGFLPTAHGGAFVATASADAAGPHPVLYRLDPAVTATPVVTSETRASLVAAVTPSDLAATARFEYWRAGQAPVATPAVTVPAGDRPVPVSTDLTGLVPRSAYRFRVVTDNGAGPVGHVEQGFTTPADQRGPGLATTLPSKVRLGRRFMMRIRVSEQATVVLTLADARLRTLVRYGLRVSQTTRPDLARLLPRRATLRPGRYLWLVEARDGAGNRTRAPVRAVRVTT